MPKAAQMFEQRQRVGVVRQGDSIHEKLGSAIGCNPMAARLRVAGDTISTSVGPAFTASLAKRAIRQTAVVPARCSTSVSVSWVQLSIDSKNS